MPVVDELLMSRALGPMWYVMASVIDSEVTRIEMGGRPGHACGHPPAPSGHDPETATVEVEETSGIGASMEGYERCQARQYSI